MGEQAAFRIPHWADRVSSLTPPPTSESRRGNLCPLELSTRWYLFPHPTKPIRTSLARISSSALERWPGRAYHQRVALKTQLPVCPMWPDHRPHLWTLSRGLIFCLLALFGPASFCALPRFGSLAGNAGPSGQMASSHPSSPGPCHTVLP